MEKYPNFAAMVQKICVLTRADVIEWSESEPITSETEYSAKFAGLTLSVTGSLVGSQLKIDEYSWQSEDGESIATVLEFYGVILHQIERRGQSEAKQKSDLKLKKMERIASDTLEKLRDASA